MFLVLALPTASILADSLPSYLVRYTAESIVSDGKLDEPSWTNAPWSSDFVWIDTGDAAPLKSRFKAIYNRNGLHLAFEHESARLPGAPLDAEMPRACEAFLDPEGRGRRYLEYAAAPDGSQHAVIWNGKLRVREWSGQLGANPQVGITNITASPSRETVIYEVAFSWSELSRLTGQRPAPPPGGAAWRANFARIESGEFKGDYVWAPMEMSSMHNPGQFGWLVFAGTDNALVAVPPSALAPRVEDALKIRGSSRFPLFYRALWTRFPVQADGDGNLYAVGKSFVTCLSREGLAKWTLTRRDRVPQVIRSAAVVGDKLYLTGEGTHAGLMTVADDGRVERLGKKEGFHLSISATLQPVRHDRAVITDGNQYQVITPEGLRPPIQVAQKIHCLALLEEDRVAVGTDAGLALHDARGKLTRLTPIVGGITAVAAIGNLAVGTSGKSGLYRLDADGSCTCHPRPLRTKFDAVFADGRGGCWAAYTGGMLHVNRVGEVRDFREPLGIAGVEVYDGAVTADGRAVFAARVANASWYGSTRTTSFLLVNHGGRWHRWTVREGLPGYVNSVSAIGNEFFLSTNAGVFRFRL